MSKLWYQQNLRFLQTVLREIDIIDYDSKSVVDYMKKTNSNCLVVNAGGVIDFFSYPYEMANPNQFMEKEILHDLCDAIHNAGMHVIVRVDFRGVEPRRYNLHPDWFSVDQFGNPRIGEFAGAKIARPCYHSYYTNEHAEQFISYLMDHYEIDGIWENALGFDYGPCYCKNCKDAYREEIGEEIPEIPKGMDMFEALDSSRFAVYQKWKAKHADRHIERLRAATKKYGNDKAFCAEIFDLYSDKFSKATGIDHFNAKKSFDFIVSCVFLNANHAKEQARTYDIINNAATTIRFSRALDPKKQPVIVTGGNGTRWRYTADPKLENRLWMWEIAGAGGGIWNCYFNGQNPEKTHDRRGACSEQNIYTYLAQNTDSISNTVPVMDVAIYYSRFTKDKYCKMDEKIDEYGVFIKGTERVLLENHIQYGFIPDSELTLERLNGVKALLIPNAALMPDSDLEIIREYVKNGGGIVASYNSSLYKETGECRQDFGLADLLGVKYTGVHIDSTNDTYQLIRNKKSSVLDEIGDTELLINGGFTTLCKSMNPAYDVVATHIPTIPNQPPEYAWIPDMKTEYPTIISGTYGKGTVVYFANQIEAQCFLNGHEDYTEIYKNAIHYVSGKNYLFSTNAPRSVHISAIENQADSGHVIISLTNVTGTSQRPLKEIVPIPEITIEIPLYGKKLNQYKKLWGNEMSCSEEQDQIKICISNLEEFASVEVYIQ